jgi:AcrR family transcriptional regulator
MSSTPRPGRPLLTAVVVAFAERGYAATSEEDLCEAMALDPADFRRRFADAEGCFLAAYDSLTAAAHVSLAAALPAEGPWATRLAAGFHHLLELLDANPAAARLVLIESQFAGEAALKRHAATLERLAHFMREGRESSSAAEQLPPIADAVLPGGVAFSLRCQLLRGECALDLYPELLRFLLLPYLGETETKARLTRSSPPGPPAR